MDDYSLERLLGQGAVGSVYIGKRIGSDRQYAIKVIERNNRREEEIIDLLLRQGEIPKLLEGHKNVMTVMDAFVVKEDIYIIMEYIDGIALIDSPIPNNLTQVFDLLYQLADGLEYIHSKGIVHRDIKPGNIMIKRNIPIYIDYDVSCSPTSNIFPCDNKRVGTLPYIAPEVWNRNYQHLFESDIYSLGVVFYYITHSKTLPYKYPTAKELQIDSLRRKIPPSKTGIETLDDIIDFMLSYNYHERPSLFKIREMLSSLIKESFN